MWPLRPTRPFALACCFVACTALGIGGCKSNTSSAAASTSAGQSTQASTTTAAAPAASASVSSPATAPAATATTAASSPVATSPAPVASSPPAPTGGGPKCTDLTSAAATAAVGKPTTVALDSADSLPGDTICDVTVANEIYPIQLDVVSPDGATVYAQDLSTFTVAPSLSGVGDKAFTSSEGVEALKGDVDIQVIGPAGPVLGGNFTVPTAIAKAMIATIK